MNEGYDAVVIDRDQSYSALLVIIWTLYFFNLLNLLRVNNQIKNIFGVLWRCSVVKRTCCSSSNSVCRHSDTPFWPYWESMCTWCVSRQAVTYININLKKLKSILVVEFYDQFYIVGRLPSLYNIAILELSK